MSTVDFPLIRFLHVCFICCIQVCPVKGETERVKLQIGMFVLIWATLLFSVRGCHAYTGASRTPFCEKGYCITLSEGELTAEAGLCVVIPCSFSTGYYFTPQHVVWYKCDPSRQRCNDSDVIFHSSKNNRKIQPGFSGRVSLLEPDMSQRNCSIMINDLKESDSGSYQLRVNGLQRGYTTGFTFSPRATVSVTGLIQKPTVMIPPMTEGQQATLTCTAPGLCSGSYPKITWMWSRAGENDSDITGNITAFESENLTAVTQTHSSTLTFNPSAEHHGTNVTCKVGFTGDASTEETLTLNVTYVKEVKITGDTSVKEGETLNLTCSVESFPPSLLMWMKYSDQNMQNETETNLQNDTLTDLQYDTETSLQEESGTVFFTISNVTTGDSGQYICTAKHLNNTLMEKVNVTVTYKRKLQITGSTTIKEGDGLNLTCSIESFPPSLIMWTKLSSNTNLHSDTGSATLVIPNVTVEHSGQYVCTAQHLDTTVTSYTDVAVTWFSKIQNGSCAVQSEVLTCVCISEGFPLPTIKWPLLANHTEYSVITTVSNHTVNSTVSLTVKNHGNSTVECVSSNENGEAKENFTIQIKLSGEQNQSKEVLKVVSRLEIIIAFLIGVLLSAIICCLAIKCYRKKQTSSGNLDETVEMVTSQDDPLIYDGQAVGDDQTYSREGAEDGAVAAEKPSPELNSVSKDIEYASIDFSLLKRTSAREAARKRESTETEYAEIKKDAEEERDEDGGEESEMLEGEEGEVVMEAMEEDEETKHCIPEEEEGEVEAVYSNVKDIMDDI